MGEGQGGPSGSVLGCGELAGARRESSFQTHGIYKETVSLVSEDRKTRWQRGRSPGPCQRRQQLPRGLGAHGRGVLHAAQTPRQLLVAAGPGPARVSLGVFSWRHLSHLDLLCEGPSFLISPGRRGQGAGISAFFAAALPRELHVHVVGVGRVGEQVGAQTGEVLTRHRRRPTYLGQKDERDPQVGRAGFRGYCHLGRQRTLLVGAEWEGLSPSLSHMTCLCTQCGSHAPTPTPHARGRWGWGPREKGLGSLKATAGLSYHLKRSIQGRSPWALAGRRRLVQQMRPAAHSWDQLLKAYPELLV